MKLSKAILLADMLVPNDVPAELKVHYLSEVEGMCVTEVMLLSTDDVPVYSSDDLDVEMLVKAPHDKLYVDYLAAMLHFANGEFNKYANVFERFNKSYGEYHRFMFNTVHPADGDAVRELYYVSAYAIAVAHGYKGSEDEFADMLINGGTGGGTGTVGPQGPQGEQGEKGDKGDKGDPGADGVGIASVKQTVTSTADSGTNEITVTLTDGTASKFYVKNGSRGSAGTSGGGTGTGTDGVGIASVEQTVTSTEDGGTNEITVTLTDGSSSAFLVRNGTKGSKGDKGDTGAKGPQGEKGDKGDPGATGPQGPAGDDYVLSETDKQEIAELAAELVGVPEGGGTGLTLIWENASPTSSFSAQNLYFDNKSYRRYLIQFSTPDSSGYSRGSYVYCNADDGDVGEYYDESMSDPMYMPITYSATAVAVINSVVCWRGVVPSEGSIWINSGIMAKGSYEESNDNVQIPIRIYGIA